MSFTYPAGLALAATLLPVVALYILKVRLRRVPVSTLMFWREVFEEKRPRSLWQTLRHWISLLLQLAFLILLVLALADPILRWQTASARKLVLVVDNSASMASNSSGGSRLDRAKGEGARLVDGLRPGDELAVVSAGSTPRVFSGLADHQRTLRDALDAVPATDGPTRVAEAVALARRLLAEPGPTRKVVVLTDGCFEGAADLARQADVELVPVAAEAPNVGITRFQARRSLLDPLGYEIMAEVLNASNEATTCRLEIDLGDEPVDVVPLTLKPGESSTQLFEKTSAEGGILRARVDRADALDADNAAYAILPHRARQPVTLVTPGDLFLEKVFEAMPLVNLSVVRAKEGEPAPAPKPAPGGPTPVTVYHRVVPAAFPDGPVIVIEPAAPSPLWQLGEPLQSPVVAKQDRDSPLMAHVRLDRVAMPEARRLVPASSARLDVLAEAATGDPLFAAFRRDGSARILALTVNLDKSDLPLQTAFPILMANALGWFAGGQGELREALPAGSVARLELPAPLAAAAPGLLRLRSPDGRESPVEVPQDGSRRVIVGPLDRCGLWSISAPAPRDGAKEGAAAPPAAAATLELACNLSSPRESDLRPEPGLPAPAARAVSGFGTRPLWYYLIASAWALVCWEWLLHQRRWID